MNFWVKSALLVVINAVSFYALKHYYDTRQVRLVSATLPATVNVASIGWSYKYDRKETKHEVIFTVKRDHFGKMFEGTGVIVRPDGMILTCAHILHGSHLAEFEFDKIDPDVEGETYTTKDKNLAYVVYMDTNTDVALLKIVNPLFEMYPYVKLADSVSLGQELFGIGYPNGYEKYVTHGIVANMDKDWIYTDAMMAHGSSGGGVYDMSGHLVGLFSMMFYPNRVPTWQGFSGLVRYDEMKKVLDKYEDL